MFSKKLKTLLLFSLVLLIGSSFSFAESNTVSTSDSLGTDGSSNSFNVTSNSKSDKSFNNDKNNSTVVISSKSKTSDVNGNVRPTKLTQASILAAAATVNSHVSKNGRLPDSVTISGYRYSMPEFLYLLSKTIEFRHKKSSVQVTPKYSIRSPLNPTGANLKGKLLVKDYYNHAVSISKFSIKHNLAPTFVNTKLGKMQYQTTIFAFSRILSWSRANKNALPASLSVNIKASHSVNKYLPVYPNTSLFAGSSSVSTNAPSAMSQSLIWTGSRLVKDYVETHGKLPNFVIISNNQYSMPEFLNLVSRAIVLRHSGLNDNVTIKYNVKNPSNPSGVSIKWDIPRDTYNTLARNVHTHITNNNEAPNFVSSSYGRIQYQTILYGFAKIGNFIGVNNRLPTHLSLNVLNTSSLNRNIPNHVRTINTANNGTNNGTVITSKKNAVWLWSTDMRNINVSSLANNGIGNIFLYESAFISHGESFTLNWINNASKLGVNVHIWVPCFFNPSTNMWINPINTTTRTFNQNYFNILISKINSYARMPGVAGIHLDYLRYPGTANSFNYSTTVNGPAAITEFTKQVATNVKSINSRLILSAAVMPETSSNPRFYGQDSSQLGKHLDVIIPMIYKGNYKQNTAWIATTTQWFVRNSGNAKIWGGLQTYRSDSDTTRLSTSELATDSRAVMNAGADGVALFRWGLLNLFNLLNL